MTHSVEVQNLYTGKILVTDKTQQTRVKAHRWAIEQVLTKVTGSRVILENNTVSYEVRVNTANYIKSFAFITDDQNRSFLVDKFDQSKIDALIRKVGASIWGQRRPLTTVWLVVEEGMQRQIINSENATQLSEVLLQSAENRGLPINLPLLDEQDLTSVYTSDIWAKFDGVVSKATERYDAEHFIMARMRYVDSFSEPEYKTGWLLDFSLFKNNSFLYEGQFNGDQFFVLKEMINAMGDYFADQYAIDNEQIQQSSITMNVTGLKSMEDLHEVEKYLVDLPPIKKVSMTYLNADHATFNVWLSGQALDVVKAMSLLPTFQKVDEKVLVPVAKLSVEEQLQSLTDDYLKQQGSQPVSIKKSPQISSLHYKWLK